MTDALAKFLRARIAEDEDDAEMARRWRGRDTWRNDIDGSPEDTHIARHGPMRVLAECEAKRRIIELHQTRYITPADDPFQECLVDQDDYPCTTLRLLALPYADHPDYPEEWKP